jgi:hypothetical protein
VPPENPRREPSRVTAAAKPTEGRAADDHERRLRAAAKLMEKMSAAGFRCQLWPGVTWGRHIDRLQS